MFRVGDADAKKLADGFAFFEARDLQNLETGQAVTRIERADNDFNLTVPSPEDVDPAKAQATRQAVIAASRAKYATARSEVEAMLLTKFQSQASEAKGVKSKPTPPTVSEKQEPHAEMDSGSRTVNPSVPQAASQPTAPRDLGRGGEQHRTIQELIQSEAQALGFQAEIERQLAEGSMQAADLIVRKDGIALAVEISITTTVDHEFGNVKKCLAAGFSRVAVVSPKPEKLEAIKEAVEAGLGKSAAAMVSFYTPDELIAKLKCLVVKEAGKPSPPPSPGESTMRGYKVRRHKPALSAEERQAKEEMALKVMAETMRPR